MIEGSRELRNLRLENQRLQREVDSWVRAENQRAENRRAATVLLQDIAQTRPLLESIRQELQLADLCSSHQQAYQHYQRAQALLDAALGEEAPRDLLEKHFPNLRAGA